MAKTTLAPRIIKVQDLFEKANLKIPEYQRPYKWTSKHVNQLLDDIIHHSVKSAYRLGTIVFYKEKKEEKEELHIVDGQQRTITLLLIALAIIDDQEALTADLKKANIKKRATTLFEQLQFSNSISKYNIRENYREISRRLVEFNAETVQFFYRKCELVQVVLTDISEAFQFFDSQNSRGKDLDPHDLLKAFHLREMADSTTETERFETVNNWQNQDTKDLKIIFSKYLYRIRNWSRGYSAKEFNKDDVSIFKGVSPVINEPYPFTHLSRIGHFYIDAYNKEYHRNIDKNTMDFPFQIDQIIINGKRFFEMINHYVGILDKIKEIELDSKTSVKILKTLNEYDARRRTGDKYVRNLFDCCIFYYWDKFGTADIDRAIEKYFVWAYSLRLRLHSVQLASIDKYALEYPFMFKKIREALKPSDALNIKIPSLDSSKIDLNKENKQKKDKLEEIKKLFVELKYYG